MMSAVLGAAGTVSQSADTSADDAESVENDNSLSNEVSLATNEALRRRPTSNFATVAADSDNVLTYEMLRETEQALRSTNLPDNIRLHHEQERIRQIMMSTPAGFSQADVDRLYGRDRVTASDIHAARERMNRPTAENPYARNPYQMEAARYQDQFIMDDLKIDSSTKENTSMTKVIDLREPVRKELSAKYHFLRLGDEGHYPTKSNMVVDSFFPAVFHKELGGLEPSIRNADLRFPASSVAISKFTAISLGVKQVHVSELCEILGYREKDIKDILLEVKNKKLNLALAGFGGTGVNFNYWLSELAGWTETVNIFNHIFVYDADKFSLSNLPRIPFFLEDSRNSDISKVAQFDNTNHIATGASLIGGYINESNIKDLDSSVIYYGAPDIATRELFSAHDRMLVSATHQDKMCSLDLNPVQNDSIQMETYGKIDLSSFFMNHLEMTIRFITWLAKENMTDGTLLSKSEKIMDYSFDSDEYNTRKRMYRFPKGELNVRV